MAAKNEYMQEREKMDYTWFPQYTDRIGIQNRIISCILSGAVSSPHPSAIFTCGTFGSGKTHSTNGSLGKKLGIDKMIRIDPDAIREKAKCDHKEATFIALLAERVCHTNSFSYLVDGSLSNSDWYSEWFVHIRELGYIIIALRFNCSLEQARCRCDRRGDITGRQISIRDLQSVYEKIPESWKVLHKLTNFWYIYNTTNAEPVLTDYGFSI